MTFLTTCRWWLAGAGIAIAGLGAAGSAQARDVVWSVGIGAPGAQVIVGNAPVYVSPPVVVHAPPRYYRAPQPVYYGAPVVVAPRGYYQPRPIYYAPPHHFHGHRHGRGYDRHERRHHGHGHYDGRR